MPMQTDIKKAPQGPGVYIFKNSTEEVIYVGKAKSIRTRVKSYFQNTNQHTSKTGMMLKNAETIEYILTDTELEALILESSLIKKHHPKYNVLLKDDKSYPYIRVSLEEECPRVFLTRRLGSKGSKYFGPYTDVFEIKRTLRHLNQIFGIRTCTDTKFTRPRPCLNYDIKRCSGPCVGKITKDEYRKNVELLLMFLAGKNTELLAYLENRMHEHSIKKEFELARVYRDIVEGLKILADRQKVVLSSRESMDIIAAYPEGNEMIVQMLFIRAGALISKSSYTFTGGNPPSVVIDSFLKQYYSRHEIPKKIIVSEDIEDKKIIADWLSKEAGDKVNLIVPKKGEKHKLVQLAIKNAKMSLDEYRTRVEKNVQSIKSLKDELGLDMLPNRIEAFDISNISGKFACGSMVVFVGGEPKKSEYRRYGIKTVSCIDDFAMMAEVVGRRYLKHNLPDLILIDGGRGQLNAALSALEKLGKTDIEIIGLAKELEEIYMHGEVKPIRLEKDSCGLHLLERVRDEAHRFAVSYHKHLRSKAMTG